jgi:hypothetical protein
LIPVQRAAAPQNTQTLLGRRTDAVRSAGATTRAAREEWRKAATPKRHIRDLLRGMGHGAERCMYCLDNLGTDIDHFQPIAVAPLRAFDWPNHLLACSSCNSNHKRDEYPCDEAGNCLLVDPSTEDPADHLLLLPASGEYEALTPKGVQTIRVFGLNRKDLVIGRQTAFVVCRSALHDWHALLLSGDTASAAEIARALRLTPFADVLRSLERSPLAPSAEVAVFGAKTAAALTEWRRTHRVIPGSTHR